MPVIVHQFHAKCPPEAIWTILSDLTAVQTYNAMVASARIVGPARSGTGATRTCDLKPKGSVTERVTVWEDGKALGLEVVESDWPVTHMRWVTRIEPEGAGAKLSQQLEYRMKFGPVGWLLNRLVMSRAMTKNVGAALEALIAQAEVAA